MLIRDLLIAPNGLLKPEILERPFNRIYYSSLSYATGLYDCNISYDADLDKRFKAYLVGGDILNSELFLFRGEVLYLLDGELLAFSWKNCYNCPTRIAFFSVEMAERTLLLLLEAESPLRQNLQLISLDSPFEPKH